MCAALSAARLEGIFPRIAATGAAWWFSSAFLGTAHWSAEGKKGYDLPENRQTKGVRGTK
jgi:hypothetical protein